MEDTMARTQKICVAVTAALLMWNFLSGSALASGFFINTQGATPLGQGNAVVAHSEDPSSIYFNPALLPRINGTQIQIGTNVISPRTEFNSDFSGKDFKTKNDSFFPSTLYITHKVTDKFSVGLGIFSNFGLSTDWGDHWEGR
jgi:long-chain fatty acid transport protein